MSSPQEPYVDPSGNTEAFQAFVNKSGQPAEPAAPKKSAMPLAIGSVAVVIIAIVVWLIAK